jgi:quinol monooxygenase YgiN
MYARVVTVQVQPGKMDEFWRRIREAAPAVQARQGFHEGRFLTDAHTGTVLGITMCDVSTLFRTQTLIGV